MKITLLFSTLVFLSFSVLSQTDDHIFKVHQINMHNGFNPDVRDFGFQIHETESGYFILNFNEHVQRGAFSRQWNGFIRTDREGNLLQHEDYYIYDFGGSNVLDKSAVLGDTIFLSYHSYSNSTGLYTIGLMAVDMNKGELLWNKVFEDELMGFDCALFLSSDTTLYMVYNDRNFYSQNISISGLTIDGELLWTKNIDHGFSWGFRATQLEETVDGTLWLCGVGRQYPTSSEDRAYLTSLFKMNKDGTIEERLDFRPTLTNSFRDDYYEPNILSLENGNLLLVATDAPEANEWGSARSWLSVFIYELNPAGEILWQTDFQGIGENYFYRVIELENGDILGLGNSGIANVDANYSPYYHGSAGWIFRLDRTGRKLWERKIYDKSLVPDEIRDSLGFSYWPMFWFMDAKELKNGRLLISGMLEEYAPPTDSFPFHGMEMGILLMTLDSNGCRTEDCSVWDKMYQTQYWAPVGAEWYYRNYYEDTDLHSYTKIVAARDTFAGNRHCRVMEVYRSDSEEMVTDFILFHDDRTVYFYEDGEFWRLYGFNQAYPLMEVPFYIPSNYALFNPAIPFDPEHPPYPREMHLGITTADFDNWKLSEDNEYPADRHGQVWDYVESGNEVKVVMGKVWDFSGSVLGFAGHAGETPPEGNPGYLRCYIDPLYGKFQFSDEDCDFVISSVSDIPIEFLEIYPNPATDILYIDGLEEFGPMNYKLFNMSGQLLKNDTFSSSIKIDDLSSGIYIIHFSSSSYQTKVKFTKQ
nr:T9SS type A sorting domain-containing protein [Saprospiraceae bacterium]